MQWRAHWSIGIDDVGLWFGLVARVRVWKCGVGDALSIWAHVRMGPRKTSESMFASAGAQASGPGCVPRFRDGAGGAGGGGRRLTSHLPLARPHDNRKHRSIAEAISRARCPVSHTPATACAGLRWLFLQGMVRSKRKAVQPQGAARQGVHAACSTT